MNISEHLGRLLRLLAPSVLVIQLASCGTPRETGDDVGQTSSYLSSAPTGATVRRRATGAGAPFRLATDAEVQAFRLRINKGVPPRQLTQAERDTLLNDIAAARGDQRRHLALQLRKAINEIPTAQDRRTAGEQLRMTLGPSTN